ncbi:AMP-binding protein [Deinococcus sp. Marseille-Q6407]|uniref:AMP-binding protein n=1 Tax=Deinococcus sp. Marseille-Q6407 TaxID=2969223 RepID=UPI0021C1B390|nr:AMP-binding protein [Deinococcus sp. Marseille-Q6407]
MTNTQMNEAATYARHPARRDTLADALRRAVRRQPDAVALTFADRSWTYTELERGACRVAGALLEAGLVKGDRVLAFGQNSDSYVLLWLACNLAGLVHVPVNYALRRGELAYLAEQSGAAAALTDPGTDAAPGRSAAGAAAAAGHLSRRRPERCADLGTG